MPLKENAADEVYMGDVMLTKRRSSSSILKPPKSPRLPLKEVMTETSQQPEQQEGRRKSQLTRRVSFADTHQIKEYVISESSGQSSEHTHSSNGTSCSGNCYSTNEFCHDQLNPPESNYTLNKTIRNACSMELTQLFTAMQPNDVPVPENVTTHFNNSSVFMEETSCLSNSDRRWSETSYESVADSPEEQPDFCNFEPPRPKEVFHPGLLEKGTFMKNAGASKSSFPKPSLPYDNVGAEFLNEQSRCLSEQEMELTFRDLSSKHQDQLTVMDDDFKEDEMHTAVPNDTIADNLDAKLPNNKRIVPKDNNSAYSTDVGTVYEKNVASNFVKKSKNILNDSLENSVQYNNPVLSRDCCIDSAQKDKTMFGNDKDFDNMELTDVVSGLPAVVAKESQTECGLGFETRSGFSGSNNDNITGILNMELTNVLSNLSAHSTPVNQQDVKINEIADKNYVCNYRYTAFENCGDFCTMELTGVMNENNSSGDKPANDRARFNSSTSNDPNANLKESQLNHYKNTTLHGDDFGNMDLTDVHMFSLEKNRCKIQPQVRASGFENGEFESVAEGFDKMELTEMAVDLPLGLKKDISPNNSRQKIKNFTCKEGISFNLQKDSVDFNLSRENTNLFESEKEVKIPNDVNVQDHSSTIPSCVLPQAKDSELAQCPVEVPIDITENIHNDDVFFPNSPNHKLHVHSRKPDGFETVDSDFQSRPNIESMSVTDEGCLFKGDKFSCTTAFATEAKFQSDGRTNVAPKQLVVPRLRHRLPLASESSIPDKIEKKEIQRKFLFLSNVQRNSVQPGKMKLLKQAPGVKKDDATVSFPSASKEVPIHNDFVEVNPCMNEEVSAPVPGGCVRSSRQLRSARPASLLTMLSVQKILDKKLKQPELNLKRVKSQSEQPRVTSSRLRDEGSVTKTRTNLRDIETKDHQSILTESEINVPDFCMKRNAPATPTDVFAGMSSTSKPETDSPYCLNPVPSSPAFVTAARTWLPERQGETNVPVLPVQMVCKHNYLNFPQEYNLDVDTEALNKEKQCEITSNVPVHTLTVQRESEHNLDANTQAQNNEDQCENVSCVHQDSNLPIFPSQVESERNLQQDDTGGLKVDLQVQNEDFSSTTGFPVSITETEVSKQIFLDVEAEKEISSSCVPTLETAPINDVPEHIGCSTTAGTPQDKFDFDLEDAGPQLGVQKRDHDEISFEDVSPKTLRCISPIIAVQDSFHQLSLNGVDGNSKDNYEKIDTFYVEPTVSSLNENASRLNNLCETANVDEYRDAAARDIINFAVNELCDGNKEALTDHRDGVEIRTPVEVVVGLVDEDTSQREELANPFTSVDPSIELARAPLAADESYSYQNLVHDSFFNIKLDVEPHEQSLQSPMKECAPELFKDEDVYLTFLYRHIFPEEEGQNFWKIILMKKEKICFLFLNCIYLVVALSDEPAKMESTRRNGNIPSVWKRISDIRLGIARIDKILVFHKDDSDVREVACKLVKLNLELEKLKRRYTNTKHLSNILQSVSDVAYRAHTFIKDIDKLYTFFAPSVVHNDEITEVTVEFGSIILDVIFKLSFQINLKTYPFGVMKPKYHHVKGSEISVEACVIDAAMNEKTGVNYLYRMVRSVKRRLYLEAGKRRRPDDPYSEWIY